MGPHKTKTFPYSKGNHETNKGKPTKWENIFASYVSQKKLGTDLPCDPVMPLLGMYPNNFIAYYRNACTSMLIVILSTITRKWNKIDVYQLMDV